MKRLSWLAVALLFATGGMFAQEAAPSSKPSPGMPNKMRHDLHWKQGSAMTAVYKTLVGTVGLDHHLRLVFTSGGMNYLLILPSEAKEKLNIAPGATITMEGIQVEFQNFDTPKDPLFLPHAVTVEGKRLELPTLRETYRRMFLPFPSSQETWIHTPYKMKNLL